MTYFQAGAMPFQNQRVFFLWKAFSWLWFSYNKFFTFVFTSIHVF